MNFSIVPPCRSMTRRAVTNQADICRRTASASIVSASSVEPTTSAKRTDTTRRDSRTSVRAPVLGSAGAVGTPRARTEPCAVGEHRPTIRAAGHGGEPSESAAPLVAGSAPAAESPSAGWSGGGGAGSALRRRWRPQMPRPTATRMSTPAATNTKVGCASMSTPVTHQGEWRRPLRAEHQEAHHPTRDGAIGALLDPVMTLTLMNPTRDPWRTSGRSRSGHPARCR